MLKLGKAPATIDTRDLLFAKYRVAAQLPKGPVRFGHEKLFPCDGWGMLGNDTAGDCVIAGGMHETMLWSKLGKKTITFDATCAFRDYSAITGYHCKDPSTDNGTNVRDALKYRQKIGLRDVVGERHKIAAYVALEPGNLKELREAVWLFGAVGIGIRVTQKAMDQFYAGTYWKASAGKSLGGHYIPVVCRRITQMTPATLLGAVTWGKLHYMTEAFYSKYCDEAWAILSTEMLVDGRTDEGFDFAQLKTDLAVL